MVRFPPESTFVINDDSVTRLLPLGGGEVDPASGALAQLVVLEGRERGRVVHLVRGQIRFGRRNDNDLVLQSNAVSKYHGKIILENKCFYVVDLHSTNGVLVNGCAMEKGTQKLLYHGDNLAIGDHILLFCSQGEFTNKEGLSTITLDKRKVREEADAFLQNYFPDLRRPKPDA